MLVSDLKLLSQEKPPAAAADDDVVDSMFDVSKSDGILPNKGDLVYEVEEAEGDDALHSLVPADLS